MRHLFIALPLLALSLNSQAADTVDVTITGTLIAPVACSLSKAGDVNLGNILVGKIDGTAYQQDLGVTLACTDRNSQEKVNVTLTGTGTTGNKIPVTGDAEGFDLALKNGAVDLAFGTPLEVAADDELDLKIVPVKNADPAVPGDFSATVTATVSIS